jgi:hypothetical protein
MNFSIQIKDVIKSVIKNSKIECLCGAKSFNGFTDDKGLISFAIEVDDQDITIKVSHPDFFEETVSLSSTRSSWDNKCCIIRGDNLTIYLNKLREAPTYYYSEQDLKVLNSPPAGILRNNEDDIYSYRGLSFVNTDTFNFLNSKIVGKNANLTEWERFNYSTAKLDPGVAGRFRWLEYKISPGKTHIMGIWVPKNYYSLSGKKEIDYFLFIPPKTTGNREGFYDLYLGKAPYGLKKKEDKISQPYVDQAQGYLFNWHFLVHQLMSSKRFAIAVFPVDTVGDLSNFDNLKQMYISLRSVTHYIHKSNLLNNFYVNPRIGKLIKIQAPIHTDLPETGKVCIGSFSAGYNTIAVYLQDYQNDEITMLMRKKWKEYWAVDTSVRRVHTWNIFLTLLKQWYSDQPERRFRLFHSDYTDGSGLIQTTQTYFENFITAPLNGQVEKDFRNQDGHIFTGMQNTRIVELHDNSHRWSIVYFNELFITQDKNHKGDVIPHFINDQHQFTPNLGIGYSAYFGSF